jgi:Uma2 family endonuclease
MATAKSKGKYTYADYAAKPDDERWELIDGALYKMAPSPNTKHQRALRRWVAGFELHLSQVGQLDELFFAPTDLILGDGTTVQPDMFFVATERGHIITLRGCEGPPDLVVEILSPSNPARDLDTKRELYARHGIPEYFILDTETERVMALSDPITEGGIGRYTVETLYRSGDILTIAAMPGLGIAVADIFAAPW